ncbi:MAG: hypothetical protein MUE46_16740 [Xanthomonadales bacterium]|jgi:hypothetical protein|nr:hypothetical protein [Xanthomonadales bacterium]
MNENRIARRSLQSLALGVALLALAGCQGGGGTRTAGAAGTDADGSSAPARAEDRVSARATERWQLLVAGKFAEAYEYLSPGYRDVVSFAEYDKQLQARQIRWIDARAIDAECSAEKCQVRIQMNYVVRVPTLGVGEVPVTTTLTETWLASDGGWYFLPDRF